LRTFAIALARMLVSQVLEFLDALQPMVQGYTIQEANRQEHF